MSKKEAFRKAAARRANGENVKVYRRSGVYCQPGRGLAVVDYYFVSASGREE